MWIWLIVLMPLVSALLLLVMPWRSLFDIAPYVELMESGQGIGEVMPYGMYMAPWWFVITAAGWIIYGLTVLFAYLDRKALFARGIDRPFPWAWAFLSVVYSIGRAVVAIRRTGSGWAPIWGLVAVQVASMVIAGIVTAQLTFGMIDMIMECRQYLGDMG